MMFGTAQLGAWCCQQYVMETPGLLFREGRSSAEKWLCVTGEDQGKKIKNSANA